MNKAMTIKSAEFDELKAMIKKLSTEVVNMEATMNEHSRSKPSNQRSGEDFCRHTPAPPVSHHTYPRDRQTRPHERFEPP